MTDLTNVCKGAKARRELQQHITELIAAHETLRETEGILEAIVPRASQLEMYRELLILQEECLRAQLQILEGDEPFLDHVLGIADQISYIYHNE